jgi:hypothetical protein
MLKLTKRDLKAQIIFINDSERKVWGYCYTQAKDFSIGSVLEWEN